MAMISRFEPTVAWTGLRSRTVAARASVRSFSLAQRGLELRDDVEVDAGDRGQGDREEDQREPVAHRAQRTASVGSSRVAVAEAVADAAHGEDVLGLLGVALELLAQVADVDVDRARVAVGGVAPDAREQHLAGEDAARAAGASAPEDLELDEGGLGGQRRGC